MTLAQPAPIRPASEALAISRSLVSNSASLSWRVGPHAAASDSSASDRGATARRLIRVAGLSPPGQGMAPSFFLQAVVSWLVRWSVQGFCLSISTADQ